MIVNKFYVPLQKEDWSQAKDKENLWFTPYFDFFMFSKIAISLKSSNYPLKYENTTKALNVSLQSSPTSQ